MEEIERTVVPIDTVYPHTENYKKHPDIQLNSLKASLLRFGQVKSVVVQRTAGTDSAYILLAGHGLTQAAQELLADPQYATNARVNSWRDSWAVVVVPSSWTQLEAKAYMVADNEIAAKALTDETALAALLEEQRNDADLLSVGYTEQELDAMLSRLSDALLEENEDAAAPADFAEFNEGLSTDYHCPKCGYEWSGKAK